MEVLSIQGLQNESNFTAMGVKCLWEMGKGRRDLIGLIVMEGNDGDDV